MINEMYSHITCSCGEKFQILKTDIDENGVETIDWDEQSTAAAYYAHMETHK